MLRVRVALLVPHCCGNPCAERARRASLLGDLHGRFGRSNADMDEHVRWIWMMFVLLGTAHGFASIPGAHAPMACTDAGEVWAICYASLDSVVNGTQWWFEHVYPYIPDGDREYYQEPFGGATQPTLYPPELGGGLAFTLNETDAEIRFFMGPGGRFPGMRAPIHRHPFGSMTYVQEGYVTLFLEGAAPVTKGPGEAYYMPPYKSMSAAVMPQPVHDGKTVVQAERTVAVDSVVRPISKSSTNFVEIEPIGDGTWFDWTNGMWERCNESPRWACQKPIQKR